MTSQRPSARNPLSHVDQRVGDLEAGVAFYGAWLPAGWRVGPVGWAPGWAQRPMSDDPSPEWGTRLRSAVSVSHDDAVAEGF